MASFEEKLITDNKDNIVTNGKETQEIQLPLSKKSGGIVKDPNFAVVCSFIQLFGPLLHFQELSIETVERFFDSYPSKGNQDDIEALFIKLLRRVKRKVIPDKWQRSLLKVIPRRFINTSLVKNVILVARDLDNTIAWDLEQFGFYQLPSKSKLELLKYLLESQFDKNEKFKTAVNAEFSVNILRPKAIGSDIDGLIYWFQEDSFCQVRLYCTEEDELDSESWKVLACEVEEILHVVSYLERKTNQNPKDIAKMKQEEIKQRQTSKVKQKEERPKPKKETRKKSKYVELSDESDSNEDNKSDEDDDPCARCYSGIHPEWILLCDKCDAAYHTACLRPPLMQIPPGDWFCPYCNTLSLIEVLKEIYSRVSMRIKSRIRAASRQNANGINLSNIRQSGRIRKSIDYTFADFDQEISNATDRGRGASDVATPGIDRERRVSKRRRYYDDDDDDSDSRDSTYEAPKEQVIPEHPERHIYLRRHDHDYLNEDEETISNISTQSINDQLTDDENDVLTNNETPPNNEICHENGIKLEDDISCIDKIQSYEMVDNPKIVKTRFDDYQQNQPSDLIVNE